jgi:hypothetical protein
MTTALTRSAAPLIGGPTERPQQHPGQKERGSKVNDSSLLDSGSPEQTQQDLRAGCVYVRVSSLGRKRYRRPILIEGIDRR